jgi:hypothetical protein
LEIGCGVGGNLAMLSRFGSVIGLELDDYARSLIEPLPGVSVAKAKERAGCPTGWGSETPNCYLNGLSFPLVALLGARRSTGVQVPPRAINEVLHGIFAAESAWLPAFRIPFGSSVTALAEKE